MALSHILQNLRYDLVRGRGQRCREMVIKSPPTASHQPAAATLLVMLQTSSFADIWLLWSCHFAHFLLFREFWLFLYFYMAIYDLASFAYKSMSRYVSSKESVQKSSNIKTAAAADWKFNNLDAINIFPGKISIALPCLHGAPAQFRGCCKKLHENWRKPHLNVIIPQCHQIWRGHVSCLLPHVATSGDTRGWRGLTSSRYISER